MLCGTSGKLSFTFASSSTHVGLYEAESPDPVLGEFPAQEAVREEYLPDHVAEVDQLRKQRAVRPRHVASLGLDNVLGQLVLRPLPVVRPQNPVVESAEDGLHLGHLQ